MPLKHIREQNLPLDVQQGFGTATAIFEIKYPPVSQKLWLRSCGQIAIAFRQPEMSMGNIGSRVVLLKDTENAAGVWTYGGAGTRRGEKEG